MTFPKDKFPTSCSVCYASCVASNLKLRLHREGVVMRVPTREGFCFNQPSRLFCFSCQHRVLLKCLHCELLNGGWVHAYPSRPPATARALSHLSWPVPRVLKATQKTNSHVTSLAVSLCLWDVLIWHYITALLGPSRSVYPPVFHHEQLICFSLLNLYIE